MKITLFVILCAVITLGGCTQSQQDSVDEAIQNKGSNLVNNINRTLVRHRIEQVAAMHNVENYIVEDIIDLFYPKFSGTFTFSPKPPNLYSDDLPNNTILNMPWDSKVVILSKRYDISKSRLDMLVMEVETIVIGQFADPDKMR